MFSKRKNVAYVFVTAWLRAENYNHMKGKVIDRQLNKSNKNQCFAAHETSSQKQKTLEKMYFLCFRLWAAEENGAVMYNLTQFKH